jgi:hypothetical protein
MELNSPARSGDSGEPALPGRVNNAVAWHIDKAALTLNEPRRYRDRDHLRFVSAQPCLICGRPTDAHHLRFAQPRALGRRVSDEFAVPLCRSHHRALHRHGDEVAWWETNKVDPVVIARELWQRPDGPHGGRVEVLLSVGVIESPESAAETGLAHVSLNQPAQPPGSPADDLLISTNRSQSEERSPQYRAPTPGRPIYVEHEYARTGACAYIAAWDVHRAKLFGRC